MSAPDVSVFGAQVSGALAEVLGADLVGVWFIGSVAVGGFVPGESDLDIVAAAGSGLSGAQKSEVAAAVVEVGASCPARGLEFTLYRAEAAGSAAATAEFEVNVDSGPRMPTAVHLESPVGQRFWYVLDRAVAHRSGVTISGPSPDSVFVEIPRPTLLDALRTSTSWHRAHERATLYSVLNACRAWRFAKDDVLGSKLDGAAWARARWTDPAVIDAAVALRDGRRAVLDPTAVDTLLAAVISRLDDAIAQSSDDGRSQAP